MAPYPRFSRIMKLLFHGTVFIAMLTGLMSAPHSTIHHLNDAINNVSDKSIVGAQQSTITAIPLDETSNDAVIPHQGEENVIEIEIPRFGVLRDFDTTSALAANPYFRFNLRVNDDDLDPMTSPEEDNFRAPEEAIFLQVVYAGGYEVNISDAQLLDSFVGPIYIPKKQLNLPIDLAIEMNDSDFSGKDEVMVTAHLILDHLPYAAKIESTGAWMEVHVRALPRMPLSRTDLVKGTEDLWYWYEVGADRVREEHVDADFDAIRVAVIDTGIDPNVQGLRAKIVFWRDLINAKPDPYDDVGHGTTIAALIAGNRSGIAPSTELVIVKAFDSQEKGIVADVAQAINLALEQGARVINMSFGWSEKAVSPTDIQTLKRAVDLAYAKGVVLIASAGNAKTSMKYYPAYFDHVISVSALSRFNPTLTYNFSLQQAPDMAEDMSYLIFLDEYSNYGTDSDVIERSIELSAPGAGIPDFASPGNVTSGTSFAAAIVSASASVVMGYSRGTFATDLSPDYVAALICESAQDLGPDGWDPYYGYGLINVYAALQKLDKLMMYDTGLSVAPMYGEGGVAP